MQYYAKVNTASPATGFITVGEVLTEKQVAALGEEKLDELVRDKVLGVLSDDRKADSALDEGKSTDNAQAEETDNEAAEETEEPQEENGGTEEAEEDEEMEPLPLDVSELVIDEEAEKSPGESTPKKKGGRRRANENQDS